MSERERLLAFLVDRVFSSSCDAGQAMPARAYSSASSSSTARQLGEPRGVRAFVELHEHIANANPVVPLLRRLTSA